MLRLLLPCQVLCSRATAQRSRATGELVVTMPRCTAVLGKPYGGMKPYEAMDGSAAYGGAAHGSPAQKLAKENTGTQAIRYVTIYRLSSVCCCCHVFGDTCTMIL